MKNLVIGVLIIALSSCEDFFQTTIKIDPPEHTPSLVAHMYINDSGDSIQASVTKSIGSLETIKSKEEILIDNAIVQIKNQQGDVLYELHNIDPEEESVINYSLGLESDFGGNDQIFNLEIKHPASGTASAVQTMPRPVEISEPVFTKDAGVDIEGYKYSTVSFKLHDPADQENYYQVKVLLSDETEGGSYYLSLFSNDPVFSTSYDWQALLLSDKTFNGKNYLVKVRVDIYEEEFQGELFIDIKGISKDFYLYARSMYASQESGDFGFTEPVSIHKNINNGLGIFSLSSRKLYRVEY